MGTLVRAGILCLSACAACDATGPIAASPPQTAAPVAPADTAPDPTALESLERRYRDAAITLPQADAEDPVALPAWFRALLRDRLDGLPERGRPQYPEGAAELLAWLRVTPGFTESALDRRLAALATEIPATVTENARRARYPQRWEVDVAPNTRLARIATRLDRALDELPAGDAEDRTPLPVWFRVYLRRTHPGLGESGPHQYPRTATRILNALLANPDSEELDLIIGDDE